MQITLNIETHQLTDTVVELFKNLTEEQKSEIAKSVVQQWFKEGDMSEYNIQQDIVIADLKEGKYDTLAYYGKTKYSEMDETNRTLISKKEELMKNFKCARAKLTENIRTELTPIILQDIKKWTKDSKEVVEMQNRIYKYFEEHAPEFFKDAIAKFLSKSISDMIAHNKYMLEEALVNRFSK